MVTTITTLMEQIELIKEIPKQIFERHNKAVILNLSCTMKYHESLKKDNLE